MIRIVSGLTRGGLAVVVFLLVTAALQNAPVYAEAPWSVRALPLAGMAVLLAIGAAVTGRERRVRPVRPLVLALVVTAVALAAVVALRPTAGLPLEVWEGDHLVARLPPGPVDVVGRDLKDLPAIRRWSLRWQGPLRVPETGTYRLFADGRGRLQVTLDGRLVLEGDGDPLRAAREMLLGRGEHTLEVRLERVGPGPRLRLGWTRPRAGGHPGGRSETIPPRLLGPETPKALWLATDLLALVLAALVAALVILVPWDRRRPLPLPHPVTRQEVGLSLAGHAAIVAIMSWPLVLDLAHQGVTDRPDGRLNAWILAWDVHALVHEPGRLFQAPIFHPLPDALAFSENLLVPAILSAPAQWLGGPVLGYNFVLLLSFVVSGVGVQLLVRRVTGDRLAAFVAGAFFAAGAHRWIRLAHLHAQVTLFLPFALLAFDRFWARRTLGRALVVGLFLALQGLSSVYLGAITATALAAAVAVAIAGGLTGSALWRLGAGFLLAALLMAPVVRPYLRMRDFQGMEFTLDDLKLYATTLESYAASGNRLYGGLTQRLLDPERVQDTLFPGFTVLLLGIAGLASAPPRYRAVFLAASAAAVVFSLGPETAFYRFLHEHVVLVRGVRALSRFSLLPVLGLAVLSGLALAGRRWTTSLLALVLMMVESTNVPLKYGVYAGPPAAARWLAGKDGAVAYLPLGERDTEAMLDGIAHFRPLVNGDSGFVPRPYARAQELLDGQVADEDLRFLRAVDVRHAVSRTDVGLAPVAVLGDERIAEVPPGPAAEAVRPAPPAATLWTDDGVTVDMGQERTVAQVTFELSDDPWVDHPRVAASRDGGTWQPLETEASLADATLSLVTDPRHGSGRIRFAPVRARFVRIARGLPARPGALGIGP
jgi:hypothetical protein